LRNLQIFQSSGFWLVTGAAVIWGTIGIATQAIYNIDNTTSLFINLARLLVATPVLVVASWRVVGRKMFMVQRRDFLIMLLSGILLATAHAGYFAAIRHAGVTIATLLTICIAPVVVTFESVLLRFESLTGRLVISLVCAISGSVLLVGLASSENVQNNMYLGAVLSIGAAVCFASSIVCGRFLAAGYHPLQVTAVSFSAGTLVLLLVNLMIGVVTVHTTHGWLLILYLGLVPTALAYWIFQKGLRTVSATSAGIVSMLDPLVTALLAWMLFGETLSLSGIAGAMLLLGSIFLLSVE